MSCNTKRKAVQNTVMPVHTKAMPDGRDSLHSAHRILERGLLYSDLVFSLPRVPSPPACFALQPRVCQSTQVRHGMKKIVFSDRDGKVCPPPPPSKLHEIRISVNASQTTIHH